MRTGFYKGYKYEITEEFITFREVDKNTRTSDADDADVAFNMIKKLIPEYEIQGKKIIFHVMRNLRWYELKKSKLLKGHVWEMGRGSILDVLNCF